MRGSQPLLRSPAAMPLIVRWMPRTTRSSASPGPVPLQQFDLQMVERIEIGKAVADGARQQRVGLKQRALARYGQQHGNRGLPLLAQAREDLLPQRRVLDQLGVARGDGDVALGQHHVHVRQQRAEERPLRAISRSIAMPGSPRSAWNASKPPSRSRTSPAASAGIAPSRTPRGWRADPRCGANWCARRGGCRC